MLIKMQIAYKNFEQNRDYVLAIKTRMELYGLNDSNIWRYSSFYLLEPNSGIEQEPPSMVRMCSATNEDYKKLMVLQLLMVICMDFDLIEAK